MNKNEVTPDKDKEEDKKAEPEAKTESEDKAKNTVSLPGVFAFKVGMSSVYDKNGIQIPVTVLKLDELTISQTRTLENGTQAVQVAFGKCSKNNKPKTNHLKKSKLKDKRFLKQIKCSGKELSVGSKVSIDSLKKGDIVKITSKSKGRGFSGAVKRFGFSGGPASHGSKSHRKTGSIGMCEEPGRVFPGRKMPGRFGSKNVTIKNVKLVEVLAQENLLLVSGPVPGARNALVKLEKQVI